MAKNKPDEVISVERMKPSLCLNEKDLPEVKSWKAGKEYDLILHVKMTNQSTDTDMMGKSKKSMSSGRFDVLSVEAPAGTKEIDESEYTDQKLKRLEEKSQE